MLQELLVALRTLVKQPGFALSVILTLALGIGASTTMFSLVDAALLRPLPFLQPDRLVMLTGVAGPQRSPRGGSFPEIADWRAMNTTLEDVALYDEMSLNLRIGSEAVRVEAELVSASYFPLLGVSAALGRTFLPDEDTTPDRHPVAVVSTRFWRERLGSNPSVLHHTLLLNDRPFQIVGVMPDAFSGVSFDMASGPTAICRLPSEAQSALQRHWCPCSRPLRRSIKACRSTMGSFSRRSFGNRHPPRASCRHC